MTSVLPRYDPSRTYDWNFEHAPGPVAVEVPHVAGQWSFCGLRVDSPLGIPAGPLLNGRWVLYYAALGFDVLTYKTVRGVERECFPLPNLRPVVTGQLSNANETLTARNTMTGSWAVSFGMPSKGPDYWRHDIEQTRSRLPAGKILSVSVVGTVQPDWTLDDLADDYARCARWALDSGADCIETNFSCPNVATCDGQLYQHEESAALVAARVRKAIGVAPYIIKIGHLMDRDYAGRLLDAIAPYATALAMTNSVAAVVQESDGRFLFEGQPRGICGDATRVASIAEARLFSELIAARRLPTKVIGVGGASTVAHVREYLAAGAEAVQIATAAMIDPLIACRIRGEMSASNSVHF